MGSNHQRDEQSKAQLSVVLVTQSHARPHLVALTFSAHLFPDEAMTEFMAALKKKKKMTHGRLNGIWDQAGTGPETSLENSERGESQETWPSQREEWNPTSGTMGYRHNNECLALHGDIN